LFAKSLRDLLKSGTLSLNGVSAQEIESATPRRPQKIQTELQQCADRSGMKFLSDMTHKCAETPDVRDSLPSESNEVTQEQAMKIIDTRFRFQDITFEENRSDDRCYVHVGGQTQDGRIDGEQRRRRHFACAKQDHRIEIRQSPADQGSADPLIAPNSNIIADDRTKLWYSPIRRQYQPLEAISGSGQGNRQGGHLDPVFNCVIWMPRNVP
jgi:hypothetical protein